MRICRRHRFDPWFEKIPHAGGQPSPPATAMNAGPHLLRPACLEPVSAARDATSVGRLLAAGKAAPARCSQRKSKRSSGHPEQPKINNICEKLC